MRPLLLLSLILMTNASWGRKPISASRYEHLSGNRATTDPKHLWDKKYSKAEYVFGKAPERFLTENYRIIPKGGNVLDMGMGEGRHAVFLAKKGYKVTGIDISSVAVKKALLLAQEQKVKIKAITASLNNYNIRPKSFDAIISFYYVDRSLNKKILSWLKPGGVLIYESHTVRQYEAKKGDQSFPEYYLKVGELLTMFKNTQVIKYEEIDFHPPYKASIVVRKPRSY